jgi:hypothetical protein
MDYLVHSTICKHIHLINILYFPTEKTANHPDSLTDIESSLEYLETHVNAGSTKHSSAKDRALSMCKEIEVSLLECTNTDAIIAGTKHLQSAFTVIKAVQSKQPAPSSLSNKKRLAPNSNMEKQVRFKSTKKQRVLKHKTLTKPNSDDVDKCIEAMEEVDVVVCGICFRENDATGQTLVNWIQCETCYIWYHDVCVNTDQIDDIFVCGFCV